MTLLSASCTLWTRHRVVQDIDSTWIAFNQPQASGGANSGGTPAATAAAEATAETEHAGFLMALGLNGHLSKLSRLDSFEYLMKGSEPISIGLLLGMAATHREAAHDSLHYFWPLDQ